ncbi:MAG TPA: SLBB domain-containing protein, partial [Arthrobacter sp.]|nr:SLBB domain-containing protein [Arthrobacter sp.]
MIGTTDPVELDDPVEPLELDEPVEPDDPVEPLELDGQRARLGVDGAGSATLNAGKRGAGRVRWRLAAGSVLVVLAMVVGGSAILLLQLAAASNQSQDLRGLASPKVSVPAIASGAGDSEQDPVSGQKGGGTGAKADSANPGRGNAEGSAPAGTAGPTSAGSVTVLVHVAGAVVHPGIVELPANSRVYQAIQRAGGEAPDAALDAVNLAAPLQDGEQLVVPTRQQADNGFVAGLPAGAGAATGTGASATSGGTGGGTNGNAKAGS